MSFFKKLKDRMFKSSSRLDAGLETLIGEGAEPASGNAFAEMGTDPMAAATGSASRQASPLSPIPVQTPAVQAPAAQTPTVQAPPIQTRVAPTSPVPQGLVPTVPVPAQSAATVPGRPVPGAAQVSSRDGPPDPEEARERGSAPRAGLLGRIFGQEAAPAPPRRVLDDDMLESLEDLLIGADMGVDTAQRVTANLAEGRYGRRLSVSEIKGLLATEIARILEPVARPLPLYASRPQVVLVVGVNGSGKTTTIGKLASQFRAAGKSVIIAAGDTFRAAAVEQLQIWGQRAGVPVMTAAEGSDPASLAHDALVRAQAEGVDLLLIDTAGRLQNRADLMEELSKIVRVIRKRDPQAPHNTLLVLDATTGQNALTQVEVFRKLADVTGLVMTKLDGTARGGVLVALADRFGLPIHAIGVGEQIDDLQPFDPDDFARALTGATE